jgi:predicted amidohydrolase YtcJ
MKFDHHGCPCCDGALGEIFGGVIRAFAEPGIVALQPARAGVAAQVGALKRVATGGVRVHGFNAPNIENTTRLYYGGPILSMDADFTMLEAIAFQGERILATGKLKDVRAKAGADAEVIDLQGRCLMPGFIDPHTHILLGAVLDQTMTYVGIAQFENVPQVIGKLHELAAEAENGAWIAARNFDPMLQATGEPLTRDTLDTVTMRHAILILNASGHIAYANSLAMERAGISETSDDPPGARLVRDAAGRLTGEIQGATAVGRLFAAWPGMRSLSPITQMRATCQRFAALGLTTLSELSLGNMSRGPGDMSVLEQAASGDGLAQRVRAYVFHAYLDAFEADGKGMDYGTPEARISGLKLIADGSNQGFTGLQREAYLGREDTGIAYITIDKMKEVIREYAPRGWQIAIHGNGDRAIDNILDAIEAVRGEGVDVSRARFRIEHCSILHDDHIVRMKAMNVSASFLMAHVYYWGCAMRDHVFGEAKASLLDRCASAERAGVGYTVHSDFFVTDPDPLNLVQTAITRKTWREPDYALNASEGASVRMALRAITSEAAWQLGSEHEIGSLEAGKFADFVILDRSPLAVDAEQLRGLRVVETWKGGVRTFAA